MQSSIIIFVIKYQDFPQVLRAWRGGGVVQNLMEGLLKSLHGGGGQGGALNAVEKYL